MPSIWYVGNSDDRTITSTDWTAKGLTGSTVTWNKRNGWSINQSAFSAGQITFLDTLDEFVVTATTGPRPGDVPTGAVSSYVSEGRVIELISGTEGAGGTQLSLDGIDVSSLDIDTEPVGLADLHDVTTAGAAVGDLLAVSEVTAGAATAFGFVERPVAQATSTLAMIGSSIAAQNSVVTHEGDTAVYGTAARAVWGPRGYWHWASALLGQRLTATAQRGVGGNTTAQMLARFDADILALVPRPGWVVIEASPNDAALGVPAATSIANLAAMIDKALRSRMRVVLTTVPPSSYIAGNAAWRANRATVNEWVKRTAPTLYRGLVVADMAAPLADPASTTGVPLAACYVAEGDGGLVHPNAIGAARMGAALARALSPVVPAVDLLPTDSGDPLNVLANSFGTGGSASTLPTGWLVTALDGTAITGTVATVDSTDDVAAKWAQVTLTGKDAQLYVQNLAIGTGWAAGDRLYAECEFETDAAPWTSVQAFYLRLAFGASTGEALTLSVSPSTQGPFDYRLSKGVFRTPSFVVPADATRVQLMLSLRSAGGFGAAGTAQATFRMRRPAIRKVA